MNRAPGSRLVVPAAVGLVLGGLAVVAVPQVLASIGGAGAVTAAPVGSMVAAQEPEAAGGAASEIVPGSDPDDLLIVASTTPLATVKQPRKKPHFTILQIGDSHTAADFFTGRVRQQLQKRFGAGGLYLPPGLPHAGIRSDAFVIKVSPGWEYQSMANSDDKDRFWLTGYTAASSTAEAEITFTSPRPVSFDAIDVSFLRQRGAGSVGILLDGVKVDEVALDGPDGQPLIHRLMPYRTKLDTFRQLTIRTASAAPVAFSGVFVEQRVSGVSYLSVGFPGAKVGILKAMSPKNFSDDVTRIAPDMVVLAFGTNEGFDDELDLAEYRKTLSGVMRSVAMARPEATLVVIGPPAAARKVECPTAEPPPAEGADPPVGEAEACWELPLHLDQVREIEKEVAAEVGATFWDWSRVLPGAADLLQGRRGSPPLFAADRVHLTKDGYRRTADAFAAFLTPLVKKGMAGR